MAWGTIIGGALGAALGGPIGAGIGVAVGAAFDEQGEGTPQARGNRRSNGDDFTLKQDGNILRVTTAVRIPDDATHIMVRIQHCGQLVKGLVRLVVDSDGYYIDRKRIVGQPIALDIPLHALAIDRGPQEIVVAVGTLREDELLGFSWQSCQVDIGVERWSLIRWFAPAVDLLTNYALRYGPWTADKVRLIKAVFEYVTENDADEMDALKDLIKRSGRPSDDECIAAYNRRFDSEENSAGVLRGVAALLRMSGRSDEEVETEMFELGLKLHLSEETMIGLLEYLDDNDDHEQEGGAAGHADAQWACSVLGVAMGAARDVVQQAWRKKISDLHPDKYANLPDVVQTLIKQKAQELNQARDILLKHR